MYVYIILLIDSFGIGWHNAPGQIFWDSTLEDIYYMCINIKGMLKKKISCLFRLYSIGADYLPLISLN